MTAKGKINASDVQAGDRILVKFAYNSEGHESIRESATKTGEGVRVARVVGKDKCVNRRGYMIETTAGTFYAAPVQTMWLAPEDAAGVKRAHAEALTEDVRREVVSEVMDKYHAEAELEDAERAAGDPRQWATEGTEYPYRGEPTATPDDREAIDHAWEAEEARLDEAATETLMYEAMREDWARGKVAAAGKSWKTHLVKFGGTVLARGRGDMAGSAVVQEEVTAKGRMTITPSGAAKIAAHLADREMSTVTGDMAGSAVVQLLETVWDRIRGNHSELPAVVMVTGSGMIGPARWGHFRPNGWKTRAEGESAITNLQMGEMFMAGETLAKGAKQVLQTMLHEAAHTLAKVRDIQDTSRQNRWHNAKFKQLAEELGLEYRDAQASPSIGFSEVTLKEETVEQYADLLAELDAAIRLVVHLPLWLGSSDEETEGGEQIGRGQKKPGTTESSTGNIKLTCTCDEPNIIRASRKVIEKTNIRCDGCDHLFEER